MGVYYCIGCETMKDDDYSPQEESGLCEDCNLHLLGWTITFNAKPIPDRSHDWDYVHEAYDGENGLCGTAKSYEAAVRDIFEIEEEKS